MKKILWVLSLCLLLAGCALTELFAPAPSPTAARPSATPRVVPVVPTSEVVVPNFPPRTGTPAPNAANTPAPANDPFVVLARGFDGKAAYEHTRVLTGKDMAGRKAGTPFADRAAAYIADKFKAAGLKPLGENGTYFQTFNLPFIDLAEVPVLASVNGDGSIKQAFVQRVDFRESAQWLSSDGKAEGAVIFLGRGSDRDLALAGDLKGKIALVFQPPNQRVSDWAANLWKNGVAGLLVITNSPDTIAFKSSYIAGSGRPNETHPLMVVTRTVAEILVGGGSATLRDLEDRANREGVASDTPSRVRMLLTVEMRDAPTKNVVGALVGSDPTLASEVVIVGGHYDHVGADPGPDGVAFDGANDNASGSAVVVALAEYFAQRNIKPKRTIVFATWSAEESGLIGSQYYVDHPLLPLSQTKGYLNLDVVGAGTGDGLNILEDSSALSETAKGAARDLGIKFGRENIGGGSDHESFLKRGIPSVFFIWQRYGEIHTPSDTFDKIDVEKLRQTGQTSVLTLLRAAQ